ncbi:unnamed protein product [Rhizophagus irregularis]|nr:unnamed protein product [Rhizophagus irregularis]
MQKSQSSQQSNTTSIIDYTEEIVRKKGAIWKDFSIIGKREDSHPNVQCKYCFKEFKRAVPQRMQTHIEKCLKATNIKALSSAKIHFSFVDNPTVIEFFNYLRPSFKIPNGEEIKIQMNQTKPLNDIIYHPEYYHQLETGTEDKGDINLMNLEYYDYGE